MKEGILRKLLQLKITMFNLLRLLITSLTRAVMILTQKKATNFRKRTITSDIRVF
jgi:hypothetical protein